MIFSDIRTCFCSVQFQAEGEKFMVESFSNPIQLRCPPPVSMHSLSVFPLSPSLSFPLSLFIYSSQHWLQYCQWHTRLSVQAYTNLCEMCFVSPPPCEGSPLHLHETQRRGERADHHTVRRHLHLQWSESLHPQLAFALHLPPPSHHCDPDLPVALGRSSPELDTFSVIVVGLFWSAFRSEGFDHFDVNISFKVFFFHSVKP